MEIVTIEGAKRGETQTRLGPMHGALTIWWDSIEEQEKYYRIEKWKVNGKL
jgi:hypothetical protein